MSCDTWCELKPVLNKVGGMQHKCYGPESTVSEGRACPLRHDWLQTMKHHVISIASVDPCMNIMYVNLDMLSL